MAGMIEYKWVKVEEVTRPKQPFSEVLKDFWFIASPEGDILFWRTRVDREWKPVCNFDKNIVEGLGKQYADGHYDHSVQLSYAFRKVNPKDYD